MTRFLPFSPQICAFLLAVAVYALFGSPTPDRVGIAEIAVGGLLAAALWRPAFMGVRRLGFPTVFFGFGLTVPTVTGILYGHDAGLLLRDVIAFLFLSLPVLGQHLWLPHHGEAGEGRFKYVLCGGFVILGLVFALRSLLDLHFVTPAPLTYFANMPEVLFSSMGWDIGLCLSVGYWRLMGGKRRAACWDWLWC